MKRFLNISLIVIFIVLLQTSKIDKRQKIIIDYLQEMSMEQYKLKNIETLKDLNNNSYLLYNLKPTGYAIFEAKSKNFIEGSFQANSLYPNCSEDKLYFGPYNYYLQKNNGYYNLLTNTYDDIFSLQITSLSFNETLEHSKQVSLALKDDNVTIDGWTYIKNYQYFQNLSDFPDNIEGSCGFVALSMLLGYLDTFYDDDFLDDDYIIKSSLEYSRGTKDSLQYLLMDYEHYISIPFTEVTRAATARYIYETFKDYQKDNIPISALKNSYILYNEGPLIGKTIPIDEIKGLINKGKPIIIVMRDYAYQETENGIIMDGAWHDVIVYGYKGDKLITHFGWKVTGGTQFILSSAIIQSYISIDYFDS